MALAAIKLVTILLYVLEQDAFTTIASSPVGTLGASSVSGAPPRRKLPAPSTQWSSSTVIRRRKGRRGGPRDADLVVGEDGGVASRHVNQTVLTSTRRWTRTGTRTLAAAAQHELATAFDGKIGSYGCMFDVRSKLRRGDDGGDGITSISISAMDVHTSLTTSGMSVRVYTRIGSYRDAGAPSDESMWTRVVDGAVSGGGGGERTSIPTEAFSGGEVRIEAGETRAFYVAMDTANLLYDAASSSSSGPSGHVVASDDYLDVLEGAGVYGTDFRGQLHEPRGWNGALYYSIVAAIPDEDGPTVASVAGNNGTANDGNNGSSIDNAGNFLQGGHDNDESNTTSSSDTNDNTDADTGGNGVSLGSSNAISISKKALSTTIDADNLSYGIMFEILSMKKTIVVTCLAFLTDLAQDVRVQVYTKPGGYFGDEGNADSWIPVADQVVEGRGREAAAVLSCGENDPTLFSPVTIGPGSRQSFYVTLPTEELLYTNANDESGHNEIYYNVDMQILVGNGVTSYPPFGESSTLTEEGGIFNGVVYYDHAIVAPPSPSASPSSAVDAAVATAPPTSRPSMAPSADDFSGVGVYLPVVPTPAPTNASLPSNQDLDLDPPASFNASGTAQDEDEVGIVDQGASPLSPPTSPPSQTPSADDFFGEIIYPSPTSAPTNVSLPSEQELDFDHPAASNDTFGIMQEEDGSSGPGHREGMPSSSPDVVGSAAASFCGGGDGGLAAGNGAAASGYYDVSHLGEPRALLSTYEGGAFTPGGVVFEVRALKNLVLRSLDVHTASTDADVTAQVWARLLDSGRGNNIENEDLGRDGSFDGGDAPTRAASLLGFDEEWQALTETSVRGQGGGKRTTIPGEAFRPFFVEAGQTVALYVSLASPHLLMYTPVTAAEDDVNDTSQVGSVYESNHDVDFLVGTVVKERPFGRRHRGRRLWDDGVAGDGDNDKDSSPARAIFNGIVHYSVLPYSNTPLREEMRSEAPSNTRTSSTSETLTPVFTQQRIRIDFGGGVDAITGSSKKLPPMSAEATRILECTAKNFLGVALSKNDPPVEITSFFTTQSPSRDDDVNVGDDGLGRRYDRQRERHHSFVPTPTPQRRTSQTNVFRRALQGDLAVTSQQHRQLTWEVYATVTGEYYPSPVTNFSTAVEDVFVKYKGSFLQQLATHEEFKGAVDVQSFTVASPVANVHKEEPPPLAAEGGDGGGESSNPSLTSLMIACFASASAVLALIILSLVGRQIYKARNRISSDRTQATDPATAFPTDIDAANADGNRGSYGNADHDVSMMSLSQWSLSSQDLEAVPEDDEEDDD